MCVDNDDRIPNNIWIARALTFIWPPPTDLIVYSYTDKYLYQTRSMPIRSRVEIRGFSTLCTISLVSVSEGKRDPWPEAFHACALSIRTRSIVALSLSLAVSLLYRMDLRWSTGSNGYRRNGEPP